MLQCGEGNSRADFIAPLREACEAPERANEQIPTGTGTALHVRQQRDSSTIPPTGTGTSPARSRSRSRPVLSEVN